MRRIVKGQEPTSLVEFRASVPDGHWDDYQGKQEAREALCREQGFICCFCQQRIRPKVGRMKIAHFIPRTVEPAIQLQWNNLFGACLGGEGESHEGRPRDHQHCDTRQGGAVLHARLHPRNFVAGTLTYKPSGQVAASDPAIQKDVEDHLNLNLEKLQRNRRAALEELQALMGQAQWSKGEVERRIRMLSSRVGGELAEFHDFLLWWLERRRRQFGS